MPYIPSDAKRNQSSVDNGMSDIGGAERVADRFQNQREMLPFVIRLETLF